MLVTLGLNTAGGEIMNYTDRKRLKGGTKCGAIMTIHFDNNIFSESVLLGVLSRLGRCIDLGQISMETENAGEL